MTSTFAIDRLECQSCAIMIESIAEDLGGITSAEVRPKDRQLVIEHTQPIDEVQLIANLASAGYVVHRA